MHPTAKWLISCTLLLGSTGSAGAQEPAKVEASLQEQLARLNVTMQEIVTLLEQQVEGQETSLLIKRVELSGRALIAKKERLRKARSEAARLEEEEESLAPMLEAVEEELSEANETGAFSKMQLTQLEQRLKSVQRMRQELARELMVLENEVSTAEEDVEVIEAVLDERLGLR